MIVLWFWIYEKENGLYTEIRDEIENLEYLKEIDFEKNLSSINKILNGKSVIAYGAGCFFEVIKKHFDISKINIIGIADARFVNHKKDEIFLGYKVFSPDEIKALKPDCVLVCTKNNIKIAEYLYYDLLKNTKIKILPLASKKFPYNKIEKYFPLYFNKIFYFLEDFSNVHLNIFGINLTFLNEKRRKRRKLISYINKNNTKKAKKLLFFMVQKYGSDCIKKNLLIANFAKKFFNDEEILKTAKIYEVFEQNKNSKILEKFITPNKTIAIVGNSGCELGKNKGEEIDSHDVVIRFNNFPSSKEYIPDYGKKTNIWVHSCDVDVVYDRDVSDFDFVLWRYDFFFKNLMPHFEEKLYSDITNYPSKTISLADITYKTSKFMKINTPTSGAILIYILIKNFKTLKNVDIYGFSFLDDLNDTSHYYDNKCGITTQHPDFSKEQKLLIKLIKKYKNKEINE